MALLGSEVVRHGVSGYSAIPYGSFAGKTEQVAIAPVFTGQINEVIVAGYQGDSVRDYSSLWINDPTAYSIDPAVPSGWSFNTATGVLTISDDTPGNYGYFTITASNAGGSAASNAFLIVVSAGNGGYGYSGKSIEEYEEEIKRMLDRDKAALLNEEKTLKKAEVRFEAQMLVNQQNNGQKEQIQLKLLEVSERLLEIEQQIVIIEQRKAKARKQARIKKTNAEVIDLLVSKGWI